MAKYIVPGTVFSILFGVAFSAYLILEMETNEQLLTLNDKLKTLQMGTGILLHYICYWIITALYYTFRCGHETRDCRSIDQV